MDEERRREKVEKTSCGFFFSFEKERSGREIEI